MAPRSMEPPAADPRVDSARPFLIAKNGKTFTKSSVVSHVGSFAHAQDGRAAVHLVITLVLWVLCFKLPWWCLPIHSLVTMRLFVVGVHDTAHGALFSSRPLNTFLCVLLGPLTFMPGLFWKDGHDYHHEHSNDLDFDQSSQTAPETVLSYLTWPAWRRKVYAYFTSPWVMMSQTSVISMTFRNVFQATTLVEWALQVAIYAAEWKMGTLGRHVAAMALVSPFGVFLFHLQHTYEGAVRSHGRDYFDNGYHGSTFLEIPFWLRFFTANIEVHHIHHLNAKVPFYRLRECHESAPAGMFDGVRRITMAEGWSSLKYALWDHGLQRLVSVEEAEAAVAKLGEEGARAAQERAMAAQSKARAAAVAAREEAEEAEKAARIQRAAASATAKR